MRYFLFVLLALVSTSTATAQMEVDGQILYGNEWIDYNKTYAKIIINRDGVYRVSRNDLEAAGIPVSTVSFDRLHMYNFGKEVGFYIGPNDSFIEFYGFKHRTQLDQFLFDSAEKIFNSEYSLVNDESAYFVTWSDQINTLVTASTTTDLAGNTLPPIASYLHEELVVLTDTHYKADEDNEEVRYSRFLSGEGFGTRVNESNTVNVPVDHMASTEADVVLSVRYAGNNFAHRTIFSVNGSEMLTVASIRDSARTVNITVPRAMIDSDEIVLKVSSQLDNDRNRLAFVKATYMRDMHIGGKRDFNIMLPPSPVTRYLEIDGYTGVQAPVMYDVSSNRRTETALLADGKVRVFIPPSAETQEYRFSDADPSHTTVAGITRRDFISYDAPATTYLMISSERLRSQSNTDWVQAYADYRSSDVGGGYVPLIADVEQLYDQYGYGVERHVLAVRNFGFWALENFDDLQSVFIIGKAREYAEVRKDEDLAEIENFYVPTFGLPGSDNLILAEETPFPQVPIGRLAASSIDDVENYLNKVMDHEQNLLNPSTIEGRHWQKEWMHLSGGDNNLQESIFNYLEVMRDTIETSVYGAKVTTHRKRSTEAISDATSDVIFNQINDGVSWITFFGHASVGSFDFNLDNVQNYRNQGKYPILLSLGCHSGNIHTGNSLANAISESFVLAENKGALSFLAASGTAYIGVQYQFGRQLYSQIGGESYGLTVGDAILAAMNKAASQTTYSYVTFYEQLTYHGDPAVRLPSFRTPDLLPVRSTVKTNPQFIDTYEESFDVCFDIANIGRAIVDSMDVTVQHQSPQGKIEYTEVMRVPVPAFASSHCITIPITSTELVGRNRMLIEVDSGNEIEEVPAPDAELNNVLRDQTGAEGFEFFVLNNSAVPAVPEEFSIVNTDKVSLIANTYNALGPEQDLFVEVDTTALFDSPLLMTKTFEGVRAGLRWELDMALLNGAVYYWRVGSKNEASNEIIWRASSFVYEPDQRSGWNQNHYFQFLENDFDNLEYVDSSRQMKYVDNVKEIVMDNAIMGSFQDIFVEYRINSQLWNKWVDKKAIESGVTLTLFDPILGLPLRSFKENPLWGSAHNNAARSTYIQFPTYTREQRAHLISVIRDSLPDDFVVAINFVQFKLAERYNIEEWAGDKDALGTTLFEVLEERGAQRLEELQNLGPMPYIFVYENNKATGYKVLTEVLAETESEEVSALFQIRSLWDQGAMTTDRIGPARSWSEVAWQAAPMDNDTVTLDIIGIAANGSESTLIEGATQYSVDLSAIDAVQYPYLRLMFSSKDPQQTAPQLSQLRVYYEGRHDLALAPDSYLSFHADVLDEGENMILELDVANNTTIEAPATNLTFTVTDPENNQVSYSQVVPSLAGGGSSRQKFELDTRGLKGEYVMQVDLNKEQDPQERYYFNNFALAGFEVKPDTVNPLLDVTFDGVQIMNEDIVSAEPVIRMQLDDSNPYLLLDDPSSFIISITDPTGEMTQLTVDDPNITFSGAESAESNSAVIEYAPVLTLDGRYKLSVQSRDATGNASGDLNYEVSFRVFTEEMVSNVFNYPNPFSTSTQFIFTLTGSEEPGNVLIRIMTLSGKVVREITAAELGALRIGMNRTDYKWDGTDEFGERLANGTYLYQVITKKQDGSDYKRFTDETQNNTDYLFKQGFGKLVILR